jgi:2-dehydropantoate 2-reductase
MKVTVLGVGAVGGWLAAGLARGGAEVALLARGATLAALRRNGLIFREGEAETAHRLPASDDPAGLPPPDILLLGLKSHDLPAALPLIRRALTPGTLVATAQNGIPWWFFQGGFGGPAAGMALDSVDPGGALGQAIPVERVLGGVAHVGSRVEAPGVVRLIKQDRMLFGLPVGGLHAEPLSGLVATLAAGGVNAQTVPDIRMEIWLKLWGNSNMNPLSALCRADMQAMLEDPGVRGLVVAMMREMAALGERTGLPIAQSIEDRLVVTRRLGAFRTSMLQDLEAGRPMEIGPILGALVELAGRCGVEVPSLAGVHGLVRLLARAAQASPAR